MECEDNPFSCRAAKMRCIVIRCINKLEGTLKDGD